MINCTPWLIARVLCYKKNIPGNFLGFLSGTNFAPSSKAMVGAKKNALASMPTFFGDKKVMKISCI